MAEPGIFSRTPNQEPVRPFVPTVVYVQRQGTGHGKEGLGAMSVREAVKRCVVLRRFVVCVLFHRGSNIYGCRVCGGDYWHE